jgi:PAS domain S-box-containing protein
MNHQLSSEDSMNTMHLDQQMAKKWMALFDQFHMVSISLDDQGIITEVYGPEKSTIKALFSDHVGQHIGNITFFSKNVREKLLEYIENSLNNPFEFISSAELILDDQKVVTSLGITALLDGKELSGFMLFVSEDLSTDQSTDAPYQTEEIFQSYFLNLPHPVFLLEKEKIVKANDKAANVFYNSSTPEFEGTSVHSIVKSLPSATFTLSKALTSPPKKNVFSFEVICQRSDESLFQGFILLWKVPSSSLSVLVILDISRWIVDKKEMQIKEKSIDASINAIAITDEHGTITYVNDALEMMYGYSERELIGIPVVSLWKNKASYVMVMDKLMESGGWVGELKAERKDHSVFDAELSATIVNDDQSQPIAMLASFLDISKRKEAEEELIRSKNEVEIILDSAADGIRITGTDFKVKRINETMAKMADVSVEEAVGMNCYDLFGVDGVCGTDNCIMNRVMNTKKKIRTEDTRININGKKTPCINVIQPYVDNDGKMIGIIENFRDISYFKYAEKKILESEQMKTEFMNMAAHELKTPLIPIRGYLEMIEKNMELGEKEQKWINICLRNVENLTSLIEQILDVSRIESNSMKLTFESVNLSQIVRDLEVDLEFSFKEKSLAFSSKIPDKDVVITADEKRMKQVVRNLLSNALKYTLEGSVSLELAVKKKKAVLTVTDTGIGLSKEDTQKLFKRFSRIESIETRKIAGTGLGLHITKKIVEMHHGSISVDSPGRGKGTTFSFTIPVEMEEKK